MIRAPRPLEFSQGTIFSGALAEKYGPPVLGLVITARCDAAHEKVDLFNYVPVVPLRAWLLCDGRQILAKRANADAAGLMRGALMEAGLAPSILEALTPAVIQSQLDQDASKKGRSIAERFNKGTKALAEAEAVAVDSLTNKAAFAFIEGQERGCKTLIRELLANSIADYHFLDRADPAEQGDGYVALLREVRFVSSVLAKAVAEGLDKETYESMIREQRCKSNQLDLVDVDSFCMPLGVVESPNIELMMQRLTQLFARIGVTDVTTERSRSLQGIITSMRGDFI